MADRRSPGLTFGQLITLTFGFLLASVVIFIFGMWVGRDLADRDVARRREVARVAMAPPPPEPTRRAAAAAPAPPAARPPAPPPSATAVPPATHTAVMVVRIAATPTAARPAATPTGASGGFTVQAYATNDMMRAVMLSRTLQKKGYAASTATKKVGGVTWYLVRVGRYRDHAAAKAMESKLRSEEGLEAASVTAH